METRLVTTPLQGGTDILVDADGPGGSAPILMSAVDGLAAAGISLQTDLCWTT
jgi:hypothetical protein